MAINLLFIYGGFIISESSFNTLNSVKGNIIIDLESEKVAKIVFDSVLLEFDSSPDYRSKMNITLNNTELIINIKSEDATSFRASINSAIKWISLAIDINDLVEE